MTEHPNSAPTTVANHPESSKNNYVVDLGERLRLMRDGLINNSNLLVSAPVGIILVPIMLHGLGMEAYGLWMAALALCALAGSLDFGILPSVLRAVAGDAAGDIRDETRQFVGAAWKAYFFIGLIGAVLIAAFGLPLSKGLHLSAETAAIAPIIFILAGVFYCANQLLTFTTVIFYGLRRFDLTSIIGIGTTLSSAAGVVILMRVGAQLLIVAGWIALVNWASLLVAVLVIRRLKPQLRFPQGRLRWALLRPQVSFGLWSQLAYLADDVHMQSGSLLIGTMLGSGAIAPFAVGQKFPLAVARMQGRAMDVIFPAASQAERAESLEATRQILETGTRWMFVLMVPLYLGLTIVAPLLLQAWMGQSGPDETMVLRLTCVAMAAAALGGASEQVIWGRGQARRVFWVIFAAVAFNLALCFYLLNRMGLQGAAWAFCITMLFRSFTYIFFGAQSGRVGLTEVLLKMLRGAVLPMAACGLVTFGVLHFARPGHWPDLLGACMAGGLAYGLSLYFGGARPEERMLVGEVLAFPLTLLRLSRRALQQVLRRIGPLYSAWAFAVLLKRALTYTPERATDDVEKAFLARVDPYECISDPKEQERFYYELAMLEQAHGGSKFHRVLEIGCGEGVFTKMLAPHCDSLLGLDNSPTALARAHERLQDLANVQLARWDMRRDPLDGQFDLIILTVLSNLVLPREFKRVRDIAVEALVPGGYLLVGDLRGNPLFEKTWWARRFFMGGKWLLEFIGQHPQLKAVARHDLDPWVHTLFQKT